MLNLTAQQTQFLIECYARECVLSDLELLMPDKLELIEQGFIKVTEQKYTTSPPLRMEFGRLHLGVSELGQKYLERYHVAVLIIYLGKFRSVRIWELLDRLDMEQLPELLAHKEPIVRHWANMKMLLESWDGTY